VIIIVILETLIKIKFVHLLKFNKIKNKQSK